MNERYRLNRELIKAWLDAESRKRTYLTARLGLSGSMVAQMLGRNARLPGEETLKALAALMGVGEEVLRIPRESESQTA